MKPIITLAVAVFCFLTLSLSMQAHAFSLFGKFETVTANEDGVVAIPVDQVNDGKAHYFDYKAKGKEIRFFLVRSADGVIRAAFDACDVCYRSRKGYSQSGDYMVCNNCGMRFHSTRINVVKGGCNPSPLKRERRGDQMIIRAEDILSGARYF